MKEIFVLVELLHILTVVVTWNYMCEKNYIEWSTNIISTCQLPDFATVLHMNNIWPLQKIRLYGISCTIYANPCDSITVSKLKSLKKKKKQKAGEKFFSIFYFYLFKNPEIKHTAVIIIIVNTGWKKNQVWDLKFCARCFI